MKAVKKLLILVSLVFCMNLSLLQVRAYNYHVTIYAALHGTLSYGGESGLEKIDLVVAPNTPINLMDFTVTMKDPAEGEPQYEFIGFQISGREDRSATLEAISITEDTVLVAVYGVAGGLVPYTINYVDENGDPIHDPVTLHGLPGDTPTVAFQYIDGYVPDSVNQTFAPLVRDGENSFTFTYPAVEEMPEIIIIYDEIIVNGGGTSGANRGASGGEEGGEDIENNPVPRTEPEPEPGPEPGPSPEPEPEPIPEPPVPKAGPGDILSSPLFYGGIGLLLLLLLLLLKRRKDDEKGK
ncbi:MAG: MucBP domain-containing protein [Erysipelotrichaceae bacterium]|nr:MucBP domain-containing protein [Erysipelotrichaceae bacterium]